MEDKEANAETKSASRLDQLRVELAKADAEHDANCERVRVSANRRAVLAAEVEALESE